MKLFIFLLSFSSIYADDFSERLERVNTIWGYAGNFLLLVLVYIILKNSIDLFFRFKNKTTKNLEEIPLFDFVKNINEYKNTVLISITNFVKNKLNNSFTPNITSVNPEMLNISITSKNFLSYNLYIKTVSGSSDLKNVSLSKLKEIGHKEGSEYIAETKYMNLFKNHLENAQFGQHLTVLKSFSPDYDFNHSCYECGGSGEEMCYHCSGSGYTMETETKYYTDHNGEEQSESEEVRKSCSYCCGTGYNTCDGCNGSGNQYDYALIEIVVNSSYMIENISNKDNRLSDGLEKNILLKNISTISKTNKINFEINDREINGYSQFESPYAKCNLLFKDKNYEIKTFGNKGDVIDISEFGEDLFQEEFKAFNDKNLNYFSFFNIRKQENYLKNFFKYKNNIDIFKDYVNSKDKDLSAIKNKYSLEGDSLEQMVGKTREMLLNLRRFSALYSLIIGIYLFLTIELAVSINNQSFSWFFPIYMMIIPIVAVIGYGYFFLRIKILVGDTLIKFVAKENIDDFDISFLPLKKRK